MVSQKGRRVVNGQDHQIEVPIIVIITSRSPAARFGRQTREPGRRGNILKPEAPGAAKQKILLLVVETLDFRGLRIEVPRWP